MLGNWLFRAVNLTTNTDRIINIPDMTSDSMQW